MTANDWRSMGAYHIISDYSIFVVDTNADAVAEGSNGKPVLVLLHGYPTSSHDYYLVLDALAAHYRVIVHDHLGFGLSEKPKNYSYSLFEQADVALLLWQKLGVNSAHVFAHDYGTSVATELLARWNRGLCPIQLNSLVLCNGSVHIELAKLRFIQKLLRNHAIGPLVARFSSQRIFNHNMRQLWYNSSTLSQADLDTMWELVVRDDGKAVLPKITQYLRDRVLFWHRWVGALQNSQLPLAFLWGANDPIVGADVAEVHHAEALGSRLKVLDEAGHYPMLEAPERWTEALLALLATAAPEQAPPKTQIAGQHNA